MAELPQQSDARRAGALAANLPRIGDRLPTSSGASWPSTNSPRVQSSLIARSLRSANSLAASPQRPSHRERHMHVLRHGAGPGCNGELGRSRHRTQLSAAAVSCTRRHGDGLLDHLADTHVHFLLDFVRYADGVGDFLLLRAPSCRRSPCACAFPSSGTHTVYWTSLVTCSAHHRAGLIGPRTSLGRPIADLDGARLGLRLVAADADLARAGLRLADRHGVLVRLHLPQPACRR